MSHRGRIRFRDGDQKRLHAKEIADGIYRINTPIAIPGGPAQFSFNQYLIVDEAPMLFHTGMRQSFPLVSEAVRAVLPLERLRYVGLSHFEADECGALNLFLAAAPQAVPVCGQSRVDLPVILARRTDGTRDLLTRVLVTASGG